MEGLPDFDVIQTFLEVTNKGLDPTAGIYLIPSLLQQLH